MVVSITLSLNAAQYTHAVISVYTLKNKTQIDLKYRRGEWRRGKCVRSLSHM